MNTVRFLSITTIWLFFSLLNGNAQSARSDKFYDTALHYYQKQDYIKAAMFFKQAYAEDRNDMDSLSFRRYNSEMWMNHCLFLANEGSAFLPYYSKCQPVNRAETFAVDTILTHAKILSEKWKYDGALDEYLRATAIVKEKWGEDNQLYAYCLMNYYDCISTISFIKGDNLSAKYEATRIANIILDLFDNKYFLPDNNYYTIISDLSLNYQRIGQYRHSLEVIIKGLNQLNEQEIECEKWKVKLLLDASDAYFQYLSHYGFDSEIAQYAINVGRDIEDIYNSKSPSAQYKRLDYIDTNRINIIDYVKTMYYLSYYGYYLNEYDYAEEKALDGIRELSRFHEGNNNEWYAPLFNNYIATLLKNKDIKTALKLEQQLLTYYTLRNKHRQYDSGIECTMKNLVNLFEKVNEKDSVAYYAQQYFDRFSQRARSLYFANTNDKLSYWNSEIHYLEDLCHYTSKYYETSLPSVLYNTLLISKGYLLEGENTIQRIANTSGDTLLQKKYKRLLSEKANSQRITPAIMQLEEEIRNDCMKYYRYNQIDLQEVRNNLDAKSVALEFFYYKDKDSLRYNALLIKKELETPFVVKCFSYSEKTKLKLINDAESCRMVWKNILDFCEGIEKIYFAPAGILQTYPIENMNMWNNKGALCDNFKLYRLTSTREIINDQTSMYKGTQFALLGGLYYDEYSEQDDINNQYDGRREALNGIQYLPGSKKEVESICSLIKSKNNKVDIFSGYNGTKQNVMKLTNKPYIVIHFATHGYFNFDNAIKIVPFGNLIDFGNNSVKLDEDFIMSHSGLYLSIPSRNKRSDSVTLTAKEISELSFEGLELVVLSACDTGLGIDNMDGVFGLQRGFKKAGARSILMSLWKVDDKATCQLMTEFYRNWIAQGKTKHDALEEAKKSVRSHKEKGWDDPNYWAAFILLDGLD